MDQLRAGFTSGTRDVLRTTPLNAFELGGRPMQNANERDDHRCTVECRLERRGRGDIRGYGWKQPCRLVDVTSHGIVELLGGARRELNADIIRPGEERAGNVAACQAW
jgi:hypothetical protein